MDGPLAPVAEQQKATNMNTPTKTRPTARKGAPGRPGPLRATIRAAVAVAIGAAVVLSATPLWAQTARQSNGGRGGGEAATA